MLFTRVPKTEGLNESPSIMIKILLSSNSQQKEKEARSILGVTISPYTQATQKLGDKT